MSTASAANRRSVHFDSAWRLAAIALVAVRFVQGWVYWGGGSRRFFYAPSKLDPTAPHWMAYKFQTAMPGALFGMDKVVSWLLQHFFWLYTSVIFFSAMELIVGVMLITGTLTRLAAACSVGLAFMLMLLFGWQGATCIDEWTMAACNFAMGVTLLLTGAGAWSVDSWLVRRKPHLAGKRWFQWLGGVEPLPVSEAAFKKTSAILLGVSVIFIVGTYSYYRGSVFTPFHGGPVSPTAHHWSLDEGRFGEDGSLSFKAYVDAGTPEAPSNIVKAELTDASGHVVQSWNAQALSALPKGAFQNDYAYQQIHAGSYGIVGPIGSKATLSLPLNGASVDPGNHYTLALTSVNGRSWKVAIGHDDAARLAME